MNIFKKYHWVFLILFVVLIFFYPVFNGKVPFPGDLLANLNPYNSSGYLGYQPGGFPNKAQGPDVIYEIYPWRFFSIDQLKQLNVPFWNPYNFSGNPQMANFQTAVFYPLNIIYFIFPFNVSWTLLIMIQPFLAGLFMYIFLKKGIGLKDFSSLIGAISFAFCSYMTVWIEYGNIGNTILWLPLVLYLTKSYITTKNIKTLLGLVLSLSIAILAGYIQGVFYIYVLSLIYYIFLSLQKKEIKKNVTFHIFFLISLALPFFITAFQILPTIQIFLQSTRGAYSLSQIEKNLAPVFTWINIVFPDFFGNPATRNYWIDGTYIERVMYPGAVVIFFALYAILNRINFLEKKFFLALSAVSLIIATNLPLIKYFYLIPIPVISTTIPTRELSVFIFSLTVLAGMGLDAVLKDKNIKLKAVLIYIVIFATTWVGVILLSKNFQNLSLSLKITQRNLILPTIFAFFILTALFLKSKNVNLTKFILLVVVIFDLFYFFEKITPFSDASLIYPKVPVISYMQKNSGIDRYWGYGSSYIPANFQSVDKTFSPEGNDPLHITTYGQLLSSSQTGKIPDSLPRPDANIAAGYGANDLKTNFYRKRILDLLGVKYVLNKQELQDAFQKADLDTFPKGEYEMVYKSYPFQIYENKNRVPRVFITGNYLLAKNKKQALSFIYNPNINLKKTLILEEPVKVKTDVNSVGNAKLVSYKPSSVVFKTTSSGNALLFLSDNFYSDWQVKIDGKSSNILIADYSFRAVEIPRGVHTVEFFYNPTAFKNGIILSFIAIIFTIFFYKYVKTFEKK